MESEMSTELGVEPHKRHARNTERHDTMTTYLPMGQYKGIHREYRDEILIISYRYHRYIL
ncbi:hypothetical protein ACRALDRAFT_2018519 [Sodiomyces alcalophilus JCM 7366]|uniref:uncharacterized protein n=1 Tax=Sodiomyces alcalophilus JCM 7366 TaxID=591952 RepID=UPI0039B4AA09